MFPIGTVVSLLFLLYGYAHPIFAQAVAEQRVQQVLTQSLVDLQLLLAVLVLILMPQAIILVELLVVLVLERIREQVALAQRVKEIMVEVEIQVAAATLKAAVAVLAQLEVLAQELSQVGVALVHLLIHHGVRLHLQDNM